MFDNTLDNKRYFTMNYYYKKKFGCKVYKVALDGGFSCPNKDGTKGTKGCIYCSAKGSGDFAGDKKDSIEIQFEKIKQMMESKWPNAKYIAYFQANSNTYAPIDILKR